MSLRIFLFACAAGLLPSAYAQTTTATILGVVRDTTGAVVPQAIVTARNTQIAFSRTATADGLGGEYSLTTEKEGFRRFLQEGITLVVNQNARIDVTLSVGQTSELVNVTAQLPDVDTHSSTTGEVVDHTRIHRRGRPGHAERVSPGSNHPHGPAAPDRTELSFAGRAAGVQDPHQRSSCRVWPAWLEACSSP